MHKKNKMKAIVAIAVALVFVLPGVGAVLNDEKNDAINTESLNFTHTVLAEFGTATTCPYCPSHERYLFQVVGDLEIVSLPCSHYAPQYGYNQAIIARLIELGMGGYPTSYWDGGYRSVIGGQSSVGPLQNAYDACAARSVADIDIYLSVNWLGSDQLDINVSVDNNDGSIYNGHLHVYVTEIISRWMGYSGQPYKNALLDMAFNQDITVESGGTWSDSVTWDGSSHGYGDITEDNILVIASVFDGSTDYVDETVAATPGASGAPYKPDPPSGPTSGVTGVEYSYTGSTTDPDEDDLYYLFNWGDGTDSRWLGPYNSGDDAEASHTWNEARIYDVRVKAKDVYGVESSWSYPLAVSIGAVPTIKIGNISGGLLKISAVIKNIGSADATVVDWSIVLDGGFILLGKETTGSIVNIPTGEEVTVRSKMIIGLGRTMITVTAECAEGSSDTDQHEASILIFFIKI